MRLNLSVLVASVLLLAATSVQAAPDDCRATGIRPRRDFRDLTHAQRMEYINAIMRLKKAPGQIRPNYDEFVVGHVSVTRTAHGNAKFLSWHRAYLRFFERTLQRINPNVMLPYWDWAADSQAPHASLIFSPTYFGGNGVSQRGWCVQNGVLATGWSAKNARGCIGRNFNGQASGRPNAILPWWSQSLLNSRTNTMTGYDQFRQFIEGPHGNVHNGIGNEFMSMRSPEDPVFWLHHGFVDKLWADWQALSPARLNAYGGRNTDGAVATTQDFLLERYYVQDVLNTRSLCYVYQPFSGRVQPAPQTTAVRRRAYVAGEPEEDVDYAGELDVEYTGEPEEVDYAGEPEEVDYAGEPEEVDYTGEPEEVDYAGEPEEVDYAGEPEEVDYQGEPEEVDYQGETEPEDVDYDGEFGGDIDDEGDDADTVYDFGADELDAKAIHNMDALLDNTDTTYTEPIPENGAHVDIDIPGVEAYPIDEMDQIDYAETENIINLRPPAPLPENWCIMNNIDIESVRVSEAAAYEVVDQLNNLPGYIDECALINQPEMLERLASEGKKFIGYVGDKVIDIPYEQGAVNVVEAVREKVTKVVEVVHEQVKISYPDTVKKILDKVSDYVNKHPKTPLYPADDEVCEEYVEEVDCDEEEYEEEECEEHVEEVDCDEEDYEEEDCEEYVEEEECDEEPIVEEEDCEEPIVEEEDCEEPIVDDYAPATVPAY